MTLADDIVSAFSKLRFRFVHESDLQRGISEVLGRSSWSWQSEVLLDRKNRLDFLVEGVCIEVKVDGSLTSLTRQLFRYAAFEKIKAFVVVTTRSSHLRLPCDVLGKPVKVVHLMPGIV